jgi:hypothetical protein
MLAAASVAASQGTANAEPPVPNVKYTLTSATGVSFQVNYITTQPPSMAAYNADAYTYLKKDEVPTGEPWVFETTLEDPQWAFIDASAAAHGGQAPAFPVCEISVDGQVVSHTDGGPYSARCALSQWH